MTKAKLISVGLAALALLMFAGSIRGFIGLANDLLQAETILFDDFSDGNIFDNDPISWGTSPLNVGDAIVADGSLTISPNSNTTLNGAPIGIGAENVISNNLSVQSQVRVGRDGDTALLNSRIQPDGLGFVFGVGYDVNVGGSYLAVGRPNGPSVDQTTFFPSVSGAMFPNLPFDVRTDDAMVQLDVIGNEITAWAWRAGTQRPKDPQFQLTDDAFSDPGFVAITVNIGKPTADLSTHGAKFRFVRVDNASIPIPEPSTATMSVILAVLSLSCLRRRLW